MTFISGTNGSGKSAVLQGMQVCLGASARSTGRSASQANFIRTGAYEARVQITLWNTGRLGEGAGRMVARLPACLMLVLRLHAAL